MASTAGPGPASAACPVCGLPVAGQAECAECQWTLRTPRRLGSVSAGAREEFTGRLEQARHRLDVGVAAVASPDPLRFAALIRGGPPDDAEWQNARQAAESATNGALSDEDLRATLTEAIAAVTEDTSISVVEIDDLGIGIAKVGLDGFGSPLVERPAAAKPWGELLPMLAEESDQCAFQLAGRYARLDRAALWDALDRATAVVGDGHAFVVCRPAGWPVLDRAAELIGRRCRGGRLAVRPVPGGGSLAELVDDVAATAPLRRHYRLMVAIADPRTLAVRPELRSLFAPGDGPGREVSVAASRVVGDDGDVTLAVFAGVGNGTLPGAPMLAAAVAPPAADYTITFALDGPGRVRITEPAGAAPPARPWLEVLSQVPKRLEIAAGPFDLVCALDLAGPGDAVAKRRKLIHDLLDLLEVHYRRAEMLRVGVVGCTDHIFGPLTERANVLTGARLAPVHAAKVTLTGLIPANIVNPDAAPVEDLLRAAATLLSRSTDQGRLARLLLVGQRGPHPCRQGYAALPCPYPFRYDWRKELRKLTGTLGAICVAVTDTVPDRDHAKTWGQLEQAGLPRLNGADARELGRRLGILPTGHQHIPIPLTFAK